MTLKVDYKIHMKAISDPLPELKHTLEMEKVLLYEYLSTIKPDNSMVLDMGCGNGRPLVDLVTKLKKKSFHKYNDGIFMGIDHNKDFIADAQKSSKYLERISFETGDILDIKFNYSHYDFDLVYSTFNTMGIFDFKEINDFFAVQRSVVLNRPESAIINIGWNNHDSTTDFLKKHYRHIGLDLKYIDKEIALTNAGVIHRRTPEEISMLYDKNSIRLFEKVNLGLFTAYVGRPM